MTDAPLDAHTAELLRGFDPSDEVVSAHGAASEALRQWSQAARRCSGRLVIADSRLHAEQQALANLLDAPEIGTAVLLAHNGDDTVDLPVNVADGQVTAGSGIPRQAAGILVIAAEDCPAFARAAAQAAATLGPATVASPSAWQLAVDLLTEITTVSAVDAAPFCASCSPMDLPQSGEDERRLRATAAPTDDPITRLVVRPFSRRLTGLLESSGRTPEHIVWAAVGLGVLASLIALPGGTVSSVISALAFLAVNAVLLSAGEIVRYRRRPDANGARWNRLAGRAIEVVYISALAFAVTRLEGPSWLLATATVGALVIMGNAVASRSMLGVSENTDYRSLRWIAIGLALIVAGPGWALLAALIGAVAVLVLQAASALTHRRAPADDVPNSARFLTPLGAMLDAGVPVRALSANTWAAVRPLSGRLLTAAAITTSVGAAWSTRGSIWPLVIAVIAVVVLTGLALATPVAGPAAWAVPSVLRGLEVAVLVAAAYTLTGSARLLAFIAVVGLYFATMETADQWRYARRLPPWWQPLADLGFDGRMSLIALGLIVGAGAATFALSIVAILLCGVAVAAIVLSRRVSAES